MQFAKDSFYLALRDRLAALSPARTIVLDGVARPAVVVRENQALTAAPALPATFYLEFGALNKVKVYEAAPRPLLALECAITYSSAGTSDAGLDRGRLLTSLDRELLQICSPQSTAKCDYTQTPAVPLGTTIMWEAPQLAALELAGEELRRRARLTLYFFPEVDC